MRKIIFYVLLSFIAFSCNITTEEKDPIEEKVKSAMLQNNVPSFSIGVIRNGKIDLLKGFGTKSRIDTTKVNESSIFQIASQSKMFTGIIVNNLILFKIWICDCFFQKN